MDTTPDHQEPIADLLASLAGADPADAPDFADAVADELAGELSELHASAEGGEPS